MADITQLLHRVREGEAKARDDLFAVAYPDLRRLARARLYEGGSGTVLDPTSLVHESYLRFVRAGELRAEERRAFFAYASQVMRSVILDTVRERQAERRGGGAEKMTLHTEVADAICGEEETVIKVHEALLVLEDASPRLAEVAQMRYFGGYTDKEIAETLGVTERTVERDWARARAILEQAIK
jgi:RNA polymerase sigma factor (TIGR02999 family)